ncbi:MAG: nucleotidyl transferase AbiEii/AbiGii toxin family protein [Minicystis sp.]
MNPEIIEGRDDYGFAGIPPVRILACAREIHIAEKLHALTMPRTRPNSRVKDLPDLALLALTGPFESTAITRAIEVTFVHRVTHPVPGEIPAPPPAWEVPYLRMVQVDGLRWATLADVTDAVRAFLNPVLRGDGGVWSPDRWSWDLAP